MSDGRDEGHEVNFNITIIFTFPFPCIEKVKNKQFSPFLYGSFPVVDGISFMVKDRNDTSIQKFTVVYVSTIKHLLKVDTYSRYQISWTSEPRA